jgi:membrane-associated phospholipid phosphatase
MFPLAFDPALVDFFATHRTAALTKFFLAVSEIGTFNFYILIVTLIYVTWNKQLAIRLSVLLLLTSSLNGLLKLIIKNPRPFVREGTYLKKWAIPARNAATLSRDYSTPSGHAMSASAFYSYLYAFTRNRYFKVLAVVAIFLVGLSRPYLGVHYVEDVLLGWAIGLGCALAAIRYLEGLCARWNRLSNWTQVGITAAATLAFWVLAFALNGGRAAGEPFEFLADAGFLTGIVIARPLELRIVNFDPRSSPVSVKLLRFFLTCVMVLFTVIFLSRVFGLFSAGPGWLECVLKYICFTAAGAVNIFFAPLLFTKMGWAETMPAQAN